MKKYRNMGIFTLMGGAYGALGVFFGGLFIKNLSPIAGWIMKLLKAEEEVAQQVTQALMQLKDARLVSPYMGFILIFAAFGALLYMWGRKARLVVINAGLWLFLLIPISMAGALFTHVNDILFFDIVRMLVSIISNL